MPVARIISSSFEDALKFADYLRPLFDTVEIAQPGRASETPVDLEVNLEHCTPEQAWRQLAEAGTQPDTDIFIAPGTLVPAAQEQQPLQPGDAAGEPVEAEATLTGAQPEPEAGAPQIAAGIEAAALAAMAASSEGSAMRSPAADTGSRPGWLGQARASLRQWLQAREIRKLEQERLAQEQMRHRQMALQFERERREREAQERELARAAAKQLALRKAEQRRLKQEQARRLEQEALLRRQAEEEKQRTAELALLRPQAEEEAAQSAQPEITPEPVSVPLEALLPETAALSVEPAVVAPLTVPRVNRLRPAMAMAAFTSVLLTAVLLGYAHRRPASPVPLSVLQRSTVVEQKVPFGPAVVPAAASSDSPLMAVAPNEAESPAPSPEKRHFQSDFRRVRVGRHEVDDISDDVTVRHFNVQARSRALRHPASDVPVSASSRGVKQISDMD